MKKIAVHLTILLLVCAGVARAQAGKDPAYRIGARDLLSVRVDEDDKLNGDRRVSEGGTINLPLIGDVQVAGKTAGEAEHLISRLLVERYMQKASVAVQVVEFRSRPISVIGAVKAPGNLGFPGRWTLLEAIAAAGGLAESHGNVAYVLRRGDSGLSDPGSVCPDDLLLRGDPRVNIPIFANDLINIPGTVEITIYCLGEVSKPGALAFKSSERISVLTAIAHAGGLTDRASKKILVKRAAPSDGRAEIPVDYNKIIAGKEPDLELRQGDVIVVKESFF